jgi:hypothetical protein
MGGVSCAKKDELTDGLIQVLKIVGANEAFDLNRNSASVFFGGN